MAGLDAVLDAEGGRRPVTTTDAEASRAGITSVARGGTLNLLGAIATALCNLLLTVAIARGMATSQAGAFFTVSSLFLLLLGFVRLGARDGLVNFVARARAVHDDDLVPVLLRIALGPVVVVTTLTAIALAVLADPITGLIVTQGSSSAASYLRVLAVFLPAAALLDGVLGATRGFGRMRPTVVVENFFRPAAQLAAVLAVASLGTTAVVIAWAFPFVPALLFSCVWLARLVARRSAHATADPDAKAGLRGAYWRFTAPRAVSTAVQVGLQRLDVVLVAGFLGSTATALYVTSSRLLVLGAFAVQAVSMAVQPVAAAHFRRQEHAAVRHLYQTSSTWLVLATWPIYLVGIMFAPTALLVFGPQYTAGAHVLVILALATMLSSACGIVDVMLMMAGRTTWLLGNVTIALTVNVVLNVILIPRLGVSGAAWAWAGAIAVNNLLPLAQLWRSQQMHPFGRSLLAGMTTVVIAYVPIGLAFLAWWGQGFASMIACSALGTVVYAGLLWRRRDQVELTSLLTAMPLPAVIRR
jgi:O-antigen/teichoic acid export membrane protein